MGILLVYDVTDEKSFNSKKLLQRTWRSGSCLYRWNGSANKDGGIADIRTWFSNVEQHATEGVNKILIGNKCDWEEKRVVSTERGQQLADELGISFMEVSAKSNINVEKAFYSLAADIKKRIVDTSKTDQGPQGQGVNVAEQSGGVGAMGGKCC